MSGLVAAAIVGWWVYGTPALLQPPFPWWALAAGLYGAEFLIIHVRFGRAIHSVPMTAAPLVIGLFVVDPVGLLVAQLAAAIAVTLTRAAAGRIDPVVSVGRRLLPASAAIAIFEIAQPELGVLTPVSWLAAIAAALAALIMTQVVGAIINSSNPSRRETFEAFAFDSVVTVLNATLGMLAVHGLYVDPKTAALALIPAAVLFAVYRAYASSRQERARLKALYEATKALHESPQVEMSLIAAARQARDMFEAEFCEIVLCLGAEPEAYRTIVGPGDHSSAMDPIDLDRWRLLWDQADAEKRAFLIKGVASLASSAQEKRLPISACMAAPIAVGSRQTGLMVVANPVGDSGMFKEADLDLLATLSGQVGVAVENGRLEDSLAQLTELKEELRHQALHDPLTGLANRTLFREQVLHAIQRTRRTGGQVSVLFLDLDDFKNVNDSLGHAAGDELLFAVSNRLRDQCRPEDTIARLGGDEFGVLLEDITDPQDATTVAERILAALTRPFVVAARDVSANASIGVAFGRHGDTAVQVLRNADAAMYAAKRAGKGKYRLFEAGMHAEVVAQLQLRADLDAAIDKEELRLLYQPIVDLSTGAVTGFESLIRWEHSQKGWLNPGAFVPFAEETGRIHSIGRWVLWNALERCRDWQELLGAEVERFKVTVNLSAKQLEDDGVVSEVARALIKLGVDPGLLVLEITETAMMQTAPERLDELRDLGVRLAIDDFGTGYSSLASLHQLPVDILKIDRLFVAGVDDEENASPFVSTIVGLGNALGLETIVEGIETDGQLQELQRLGCGTGQGFYFAKPLSADQATALLERQLKWGYAFDLEELSNGQSNMPYRTAV